MQSDHDDVTSVHNRSGTTQNPPPPPTLYTTDVLVLTATFDMTSNILSSYLKTMHPLMRLIIENRHEKIRHNSDEEHLITEIRPRFWIVNGRQVVQSAVEHFIK
jgi:hypothetical protein